jgi:hypothetical protein
MEKQPYSYSADFEQAWKAYGRVPNQSKITAAISWDKAKKIKVLPDLAQVISAIGSYRQWLSDAAAKNKPIPQAHMATWINQQRWASWLPEEPVQSLIQDAPEPSSPSWPQDLQDKFAATGLSQAEWQAWMAPSNFIAGPPPAIICPSKLFVSMIEARYRRIIDRVISPETRVSVSL